MGEYKSFYKVVEGNEGSKCNYATRLDTYGKGCQHDCSYCYAKSLLDFRKNWDAHNPSIADINKIKRKISKLPKDIQPLRLGGLTDCFQPLEKKERVTYETIKCLNENHIPYLIVTKSAMVADDEYISILDKNLAHIQITVTSTSDTFCPTYEHASLPSERIKAIQRLQSEGFDVQIRLSPYIPEYIDVNILKNAKIKRCLVEFLRVNHWIQEWFPLDYSNYTVKQSGYRHLPLSEKIILINQLKEAGFEEISVCEDETEAYDYWKNNFNPNKDDCCNLKFRS